MKKYLLASVILINNPCFAGLPVFSVTPNFSGDPTLPLGQQGTYVFQVTNNTRYTLSNIGLRNLPSGVAYVANGGYQYCSMPLTLQSGASCLLKLNVNSNTATPQVNGGPQVCYTPNKPVYCSQPFSTEQIDSVVLPAPAPDSCNKNVSNFNYELSQTMDSSTIDPATIQSWGPGRNHLLLSSSYPDLTKCTTTNLAKTKKIAWMETRVLAAEDFWVKKKLNYCHHHVVDFATPAVSNGVPRNSITSGGGFCSNSVNIYPGTVYYNQPVHWNYNGKGSDTSYNWLNNNYMWYGVDCSDFTSFIYNFAFGIQFNSDTGYQAGQATDGTQDNLTPNGQKTGNQLKKFDDTDPNSPAGVLVCKDGRTEQENPECGGFGTNGYFSVFLNSDIRPTPANVTSDMLKKLKPGDLIFLAFAGNDGNNPRSMVTHAITWTGMKVGYGANDVNPSQIAPEDICPNNWQPQIGDWVIIDSHYQGPDYRVFSKCFYQNNIYGVRRVVGYMKST